MTEIPHDHSDMLEISPEGLNYLRTRIKNTLVAFGEGSYNTDARVSDDLPSNPMRYTYDINGDAPSADRLLDAIKTLLYTPDELDDQIILDKLQVGYSTPHAVYDGDDGDAIVWDDAVYVSVDAKMPQPGVDMHTWIAIVTSHETHMPEGAIRTEYSQGNSRIGFGRTDFSGEDLSDPDVVRAVLDSYYENERPLGLTEAEIIEQIVEFIEATGSTPAD